MLTQFNPNRSNQDWTVGQIAENAFKEQCIMWGMTIHFQAPSNKPFAPYDFEIQYSATHEKQKYPNETFALPPKESWEIKMDMGKTENIPIHFYSSSKQVNTLNLPGSDLSCNAGLYRTEADFYCVFNPHDELFYISPGHVLRDYSNKNPQIKKVLANKHKSEQTGIALIPKTVWLREFYHLPYTYEVIE